MSMDKIKIALKYGSALPAQDPAFPGGTHNRELALSMSAEMMKLGFIPSEDLVNNLQGASHNDLVALHETAIPVMRKLKGVHVSHKPMYPNFPAQVMEMSYLELFFNAIAHYWSFGEWMPQTQGLDREYEFENIKFQEIGAIDEDGLREIYSKIVSSKDSISVEDQLTIKWFMDNSYAPSKSVAITFKETLCFVAGQLLERGKDISGLVTNATDVLRIATALSEGDISLGTNTKFKSLPRATRRILVQALEKVIREEDLIRHKNKWVRLAHNLHVGDHSVKVFKSIQKLRNNTKIQTFNGLVEQALLDKNLDGIVGLLIQRPGDYARRLGHVMRIAEASIDKDPMDLVTDTFLSVVDKIPTRNLTQLLGSLKSQYKGMEQRVVFPKGSVQKARLISGVAKGQPETILMLIAGIASALRDRFSLLESLGKVWIDPALRQCPLPTQIRSASESLFQVARGTHMPIGDDKNTLRFFVYWKGRDIDLSATLHDEDFKITEQISYTHLRSRTYEACHSGDIVSAPDGASEFIDITIDKAVEHGARYVAMNVYVYSGPNFSEHEECFAGWMTRSTPQSNEIYDPKTVIQKVDLRQQTRNVVPVIFDLLKRKAIWVDLTTRMNTNRWGNNVHSNRATIEDVCQAITSLGNKTTLHELFTLHGEARGEVVETKEEADTVFSMYEGITPYNVIEINADYMV